jgi:hypothetical protein
MELIERYNTAIRKLNSLELEKVKWVFDEISENDKITLDSVEWMEDNVNETEKIYKKLKLGIYSEMAVFSLSHNRITHQAYNKCITVNIY